MLHNVKATEQAYKIVLAIWERSILHTHHFLSEEDRMFYKEQIPQFLSHVELLLWLDEEQVIGFSGTNGTALEMLFIDPKFIGKGFGSQILNWLVENKKIDKMDVNEQNLNAKRFYFKHGFTVQSKSETDGFGKVYPILHLKK